MNTNNDLKMLARIQVHPGLKEQIEAILEVHGLGDGVKWIEDQMKRVFGSQVNYLVDFYHLSEYLAKAAEHSWTSEKNKLHPNCTLSFESVRILLEMLMIFLLIRNLLKT